ncbi:unnamed protein product, partial [Timema podura]|nr:unnamed protein product [Timema podura]
MMTTSTANPTTIRPTSSYKDFDLHNYNIKSSTKKTSEYDKHPNEVVKNEELTYNHAIRISAANYIVLLMFTTVVLFERLVGRIRSVELIQLLKFQRKPVKLKHSGLS